MSEKPKFYLTTAIPYVNASPHIGFALELVQTDTIARFKRLTGHEVFFLTGADENSLKNVQAAEAAGLSTQELVDRNTQRFIDLTGALDISNDDFIRTVSEKHFAGVQKLWSACRPEDIYKKSYKGLYCVGCETFYNESELVDGVCPEHQTRPEVVEEENYFFRLSNYQEKLEKMIESDEYRVVPESRKNEVLSFVRGGLQDFSISRSQARARNWGVPVPGDPGQVMYVWFDALGNYITGVDYAAPGAETDPESTYARRWPADLHVIGKGIIRFHAVYWPAMLMSAGVPLPKNLFVHGYINIGGAKMSKSLGNIIDPFVLAEKYGVEPLRFYLIKHLHPVQDSDFGIEQLETAYTADLANGIGNLLSRSLTMIERNCEGAVRVKPCDGEGERAVREKLADVFAEYRRLMERFEFSQAMGKVWEGVTALDRYINEQKPWSLAKQPEAREQLETVLYVLAEGLRMIASLIYPVMPATAAEIWRRLGLEREILAVAWEDHARWGMLTEGLRVTKGEALFPRLEKPAEPAS
jgi:methionyl-tRNA synthetase